MNTQSMLLFVNANLIFITQFLGNNANNIDKSEL